MDYINGMNNMDNNDNNDNNNNYNKGGNKVLAIIIIIAIIVVSSYFVFDLMLKQIDVPTEESNENYVNDTNEKNDSLLIGKWYVYSNGTTYDDSYILFNKDGSYEYSSTGSKQFGTYTYVYGVTTRTSKKIYLDDAGYIYYDVILSPTKAIKGSGEVITSNLKQLEFAIGINKTNMNIQNLTSGNLFTLVKK